MSGVKLVNETDQDIILLEGTGGVYRSLKTIPRGKKHVLKVDPNETYREYRCRLRDEISRSNNAVVLTPFVFAEFTHVTIKWDQFTDKLSYETKKKGSGNNGATDMPSGQANAGLFQRLLSKFSWKREHAPSDARGDGGDVDGEGEGGGGSSDATVPRRGGALDIQQGPVLSSNV